MVNRSAVILPLVLLFLPIASLSQLTPGGVRLSGLSSVDQQNREQEKRNDRDMDRRLNSMRDLENNAARQSARMREAGYIEPKLTSDSKERIKQYRKVDASDLKQYGEFLRAENTGIFKLFPNYDCQTENVIRVDGECETFVPMSSNFSFRQKSYIDFDYSDLQFYKGELNSSGFFTQGIFLSLGELPIETVSLESIRALTEVTTASNFNEARVKSVDFYNGVAANGSTLISRVKPQLNNTYAIRIIAYKVANSFPPVTGKTPTIQLKFMSLSYDKRSDEIIVFKIVRKDEIGGLTLVWKQLSKRDAPKIKFSKDEPLSDFR